ncbi:MAG: NfeD family protein [Tissierellia bacterium]|nr:NfeD family protein [Tissierellia bacterium]
MNKRINLIFLILLILLLPINVSANEKVYVIPIKGDINGVTYSIAVDGIREAEKEGANAIVFEIDTYGGFINSAEKIKNSIIRTSIPTISYVNNKAESAGVLISIASEKLAMNKTATIGSARTIPDDEKVMSLWLSILRDTAQYRGRDDQIIAAMADSDIELDNIVSKGKLLNLTAREADEHGLSDYTVDSLDDLMTKIGFENPEIVNPEISAKNRFASILTNPILNTVLLIIGFVGAVVELFIPGFGVAGVFSILGFGLFFAGNIISGNAEWMSLLLFILGGVLIFVEVLIPGFGLPGISGIVLTLLGLLLAMKDISQGLLSLSIAIIIAAIVGFFIIKKGFESPLIKRVILSTNLDTEDFKPDKNRNVEMLGKKGISVTILRPSGTIEVEGMRYDAITEGDFIPQGVDVEIFRVVGTKIFVRRI